MVTDSLKNKSCTKKHALLLRGNKMQLGVLYCKDSSVEIIGSLCYEKKEGKWFCLAKRWFRG